MKKITLLILLFIISFTSNVIFAQWKQIGPEGGEVLSLLYKTETIYAGTQSGLFSSIDTSKSWKWIKTGDITVQTSFVKTDVNDNIFMGTKGDGISKSTDGGSTWTNLNNNENISSINDAVFIGNEIFAAGIGGIDYSNDNGATWNVRNTGLTNISAEAIYYYQVGGNHHLLVGTKNGIFHSSDWAVNWNETSTGLTNKEVTCITHYTNSNNQLIFFAGTYGGGVFKSIDTAKTWSSVNNQLSSLFILSLFQLGNDLYAGTAGNGVFKTALNTMIWNAINTNIASLSVNYFLNVGINLIIATSAGIFTSLLNPINWVAANTGLFSLYVYSMSAFNNVVYAATGVGLYSNGINDGPSWTKMPLAATLLQGIYFGQNVALASSIAEGTFKSTDQGQTWALVNGLTAWWLSGIVLNEKTGTFLGINNAGGGIFRSTDNGQNWSASNNGITTQFINDIKVDTSNNAIMAATDKGLYKSTDDGQNWTRNTSLPDSNIISISFKAPYAFAISFNDVYSSVDNGITYHLLGDGLTANIGILHIVKIDCAQAGCNVPAGATWILNTTNGSFFTKETDLDNNIFNWNRLDPISSSFNFPMTSDIILNNNVATSININKSIGSTNTVYLYVGTFGLGVWSRDMSDIITAINDENVKIPNKFSLSQNYPNPFNPSTVISYTIPSIGTGHAPSVLLRVYDVLGREVTTLVNKEQKAGNYKVNFDASRFASGVYFYRIIAGKFIQTKKMILLK